MAAPTCTDDLRQFLREELREDSNATLATALVHLANLCESGPSDSISPLEQCLTELTELNKVYSGHTPLSDFLAQR